MNCEPNRKRETFVFTPIWGPEYEKWAKGFIRNHKWRVDRLLDEDDLMQEAWITFNYVANTYPRCNCSKHFMALFKRAMINKMNDRSCRVKRRRETPEGAISCDITEVLSGRIGEITNGGYLAALLNEQPEELKIVLKMLADGKLDAPEREKGLQPRENFSMRAKRLLGIKGDPVRELRQLLT